MNAVERDLAVAKLIEAERAAVPIVQLSQTWPGMTIEDAYAISSEVARRRMQSGARLIGHKIGLTSKAMQRSSMIDEPDYGHLFDDMLLESGARVARSRFCVPRVEIELTFLLKRELRGPGVAIADVLRATEYVIPSIEIIDARIQNPRTLFDTVADNGAAARIVLGGRPIGPDQVDLRWVAGALYRNGEIEETGVACGVLGHPALGVAWLANRLARFDTALSRGHLVMSGSFIRPVWAEPGDTLHGDFGPLGAVAVRFT